MMREMLSGKIHRATVTEANLHYVGSITVDKLLLEAANILPYEKVQVANVNNGERFETYALEGAAGSGVICLNGATARLALPGDLVIIMSYALVDQSELEAGWQTQVVLVDENNRIM